MSYASALKRVVQTENSIDYYYYDDPDSSNKNVIDTNDKSNNKSELEEKVEEDSHLEFLKTEMQDNIRDLQNFIESKRKIDNDKFRESQFEAFNIHPNDRKINKIRKAIRPEFWAFEELTISDRPYNQLNLFHQYIINNFSFKSIQKPQRRKNLSKTEGIKQYSTKQMLDIYFKTPKNNSKSALEFKITRNLNRMAEIKTEKFFWHLFDDLSDEYKTLKNDCTRIFKFKMLCSSNNIDLYDKSDAETIIKQVGGCGDKMLIEVSVLHHGENLTLNHRGVQNTKYENTRKLKMLKMMNDQGDNDVTEDEDSVESGVYI